MSRKEKKLVPTGPPKSRRRPHQMGVAEVIPPALHYTSGSADQSDIHQPSNATRVPWKSGTPGTGFYDDSRNTIAISPSVAATNDDITYPHEIGHALWLQGGLPEATKNQWGHIHNERLKQFSNAESAYDSGVALMSTAYDEFKQTLPEGWTDLDYSVQADFMAKSPQYKRFREIQTAVFKLNEAQFITAKRTPDAITEYDDDPSHSWAEVFGTYVGTPEQLEKSHPDIYSWMRSVIGREYKTRDAAEAQSPAAHIPFYWGSK